jgi:hypothetical protein
MGDQSSLLYGAILVVATVGLLAVVFAAFKMGAFRFTDTTPGTPVQGLGESVREPWSSGNLPRDYHRQGLAQSKVSFWFSILAGSFGFLVVLVSLFLSVDKGWGRAAIPILAGSVIDAFSALIFVQSNKARQQMAEFFDKLRTDEKLQEGLKLCAVIPDVSLQNKVRAVLAFTLSGAALTDEIIASIALGKDKFSPREVPLRTGTE